MASLPPAVVQAKKTMGWAALKGAEITEKRKADAEKAVSAAQDADGELRGQQRELIEMKANIASQEASIKAEYSSKLAIAEEALKKASSPQSVAVATAALQKVRADEKKAKEGLRKHRQEMMVAEARLEAETKKVDAMKTAAENAVKIAIGKGKTRRFLGKKKDESADAPTFALPPWGLDLKF
jgi:hypothetical protein